MIWSLPVLSLATTFGFCAALSQGPLDGALDRVLDFLLPDAWGLLNIYLGCAVIGGTILTLQMLLLLIGGIDGDADFDMDIDADAGEGLSFLSIRAMASFLTFFGLAGYGGTKEGWATWVILLVALGAGLSMLFFVAWMMAMYKRLTLGGNLDPTEAVGKTARVYLRIPGANAGKGKVTVSVQGREVQFDALTEHPEELPTGSDVSIVSQLTSNTFNVMPLSAAPPQDA